VLRHSPIVRLLEQLARTARGTAASHAGLRERGRRGEAGQALPLFVLMIFVITGSVAVVTDVSWFWVNQQKMQRAADAGALAGAVFLPGNVSAAYDAARAATKQNGYTDGLNGVIVTPLQDSGNRRRLGVTVQGPVGTYFARVFGMNQITAKSSSKAEFTLPVPMGSPQNYYGVGYLIGATATTTNTTVNGDSDWRPPTATVTGGQWASATSVYVNDNVWASESTNAEAQQWNAFGLQGLIQNDPSTVIDGLQVRLTDVSLTGTGTATNCQVRVETSWDGGTSWSTQQQASGITSTASTQTLGSDTSYASWGAHTWTRADFSDTNFRVRLTWQDGTAACASTQAVKIDLLEVRVDFHYTQSNTTYTVQQQNVSPPGGGSALAPQNFWGAMQSQGAPNIQGDAYMPKYEIRTSSQNSAYDPDNYYNYGVDMPAGSTGGRVYVFDPGFCDTGTSLGVGENWNIGGSLGYDPPQPISAYFDLYNTRGTPYDYADDVPVASSNNTFERLSYEDVFLKGQAGVSTLNPQQPDCSGQSWHNGWWQLASGLTGGASGTTYRLHAYSTDPSSANDQNNSVALNAYAFYASATGGTPRVYGIGAMEAYIRLPGGQASEFYLAQIDAANAGKTIVIDLWDPGDTGALSASLQILQPTAASYSPVSFDYSAVLGTSHSGASTGCGGISGTASSVVTNTGGSSRFNGCWLTIEIALPNTYTAPHPSSDTLTAEAGWWKIRYTMGGSTSNFSTDLTTWKVGIRGSPVHLVR
jgi:hypothetical protein